MKNKTYTNILAPLDGSDISKSVAFKAATIANQYNANLDLLYVIDTNSLSGMSGMSITSDVIYHLVQDSQEKLENYKNSIIEQFPNTNVYLHIRFGSPKKIIAFEFPEDHNSDLTIIGKSGLNKIERIIVGSVASFVVQNAKNDILIVQK